MKAVMYGAGSIGRGFIGALFSEIGYEVVFIDVNDDVIHLINKEKTYPQISMNEEQPVHWIKNIRAVDGKDSEAVLKLSTDIMTRNCFRCRFRSRKTLKLSAVLESFSCSP